VGPLVGGMIQPGPVQQPPCMNHFPVLVFRAPATQVSGAVPSGTVL
jgi:hypothetical protein